MKSFESLLCSLCPITYARSDIPLDELEVLIRTIRGRFPYSVETGLAYTGKQRFIALHWDPLSWSIAASDGNRLVTTAGALSIPSYRMSSRSRISNSCRYQRAFDDKVEPPISVAKRHCGRATRPHSRFHFPSRHLRVGYFVRHAVHRKTQGTSQANQNGTRKGAIFLSGQPGADSSPHILISAPAHLNTCGNGHTHRRTCTHKHICAQAQGW